MKFVLNRDKLVHGLGHSVMFRTGVPTEVPKPLWKTVMSLGAVPEDGKPVTPPEEEDRRTAVPNGDARAAVIRKAIIELIAENDSDKFGANNRPRVSAVRDLTGFTVDRKEIDAVWEDIRKETASEEG
jgi:hypothetical protein